MALHVPVHPVRFVAAAGLFDGPEVAMSGGNVFAELMNAVRHRSLGQISDAFFVVGGQYRRNV